MGSFPMGPGGARTGSAAFRSGTVRSRIDARIPRQTGPRAGTGPASSSVMLARAMAPPTRILLVDDDEDVSFLVRDHLEDVGEDLELEWAPTFEAGMQALEGRPFDACLLDQHLGARTGLQFLEELRGRGSTLPVILLTSEESLDLDRQASRAGACDFLVKAYLTGYRLDRAIRRAMGPSASPAGAPAEAAAPGPVPTDLAIEVRRGGTLLGRGPLTGSLSIGRSSSNDLTLDAPSVSRVHARVILDSEGVRVVDAGSMNGLTVNGSSALVARIGVGDVIELGGFHLALVPTTEVVALRTSGEAPEPGGTVQHRSAELAAFRARATSAPAPATGTALCPAYPCVLFDHVRSRSTIAIFELHYCRGDHASCARQECAARSEPIPIDLLPTGDRLS